jgi:hypothetical protein
MPCEVICIFGPSRAGKTSLLSELINTVCGKSNRPDDEQHLVMVEVGNNGGKASFSFKAFILELLEAIRHPIYSSSNYGSWGISTRESRVGRTTEATLVHALIEALIHRKTRYLVVDEAQDMKYAGKNTMAASGVMDALKTLAKKANVVLVVCGTYPMLESINCSGHLENRKHDVHLPRYRKTEEDMNEFIWILANYDAALELDDSLGSIQNCAELLYEGTYGCIGLIRAWLYRASVLACIDGKDICLSHIQRSMKSANQLVTVEHEIDNGEKLLAIPNSETIKKPSSNKQKQPEKSKKKAQKPFQRKPARHAPGNRL